MVVDVVTIVVTVVVTVVVTDVVSVVVIPVVESNVVVVASWTGHSPTASGALASDFWRKSS
jgi:hypothetical protein